MYTSAFYPDFIWHWHSELLECFLVILTGGSYTSSCFDVYYNSSAQLLSATCGTGGGYMETSVNTSYCTPTSTIGNDHGVLVCSDYTSAVPAGSWQDSCGPVSYSPGLAGR